jgi:hypothetical protein
VKNVHVFESQLAPARSKYKGKINDITKLHNFVYESTNIRSYRAWNIGSGKTINLDMNQNVSWKFHSLVCKNSSSEPSRLINSSADNRSNDVASSVAKDFDTNDPNKSKSKLFFCDYEGCIRRFLNYGNLLRHIATGNHVQRPEKLSMKDYAMITYKNKLDADNNQDHLCLELEKVHFNRDNYNHISPLNIGWGLPLNRKVQKLTPKVREFLKKKFDDGQRHGIRWQPEAVVHEIKYGKDPETKLYLFDITEFVKVSTVRSFFSRQKASIDNRNDPKPGALEDNSFTTTEQYDSEESNEDEAFEEQLAVDLELQFAYIRSTINNEDKGETNLTTTAAKRELSSLENENIIHKKKSPRFPRKNN